MRAVALLSFWKFKNSMRTLFRDPRKLVPFLFLIAILSLTFVGYALLANESAHLNKGKPEPMAAPGVVFLAMVATGFLVLDTGFNDGLLAFPMSDVDYLFPSPISRRAVIAYRLPSLLFSVLFLGGTALFLVRFLTQTFAGGPNSGPPTIAPGVTILGVLLGVGTYMNLATCLSMRFPDRRPFRKWLWVAFVLLGFGVGFVAWNSGRSGINHIPDFLPLRVLFLPSFLMSQVIVGDQAHHSISAPLGGLALVYALSFIPIFTTNENWYEQSIAGSERFSRMRAAAKGGYASMMAAKAAEAKPGRSQKGYAVRPFGQGTLALFWAHLTAAAKRPFLNFGTPLLAGIACGAFGGFFGARFPSDTGQGILMPLVIYANILFLGTAKTASEAAIRRRDILVPLPIGGWQSVAANLGVPAISTLLFFFPAGCLYAFAEAPLWPMISFGLGLLLPVRLAARMVLQYIVVLAYSDFSDKPQQFLGQIVSYLLGLPLLVLEFVVCLPALFLHSVWLALVSLFVLECLLLAGLLFLAGRAADRAIASGEPVGFWRLIRR